jgi:hypothetical protein
MDKRVINMPEKTLTDSAYELIEGLENRKRWVLVIMGACFVVAPIGLGFDALSFTILSHQKGGVADTNLFFIAITAAICIVIMAFGTKKYILIKKWEKQLGQLEQLEKTICQEVLSYQRE